MCETLRDPLAAAVSLNRFSIQASRIPMLPPEELPACGFSLAMQNYRTARPDQQLTGRERPQRIYLRDEYHICKVMVSGMELGLNYGLVFTTRVSISEPLDCSVKYCAA